MNIFAGKTLKQAVDKLLRLKQRAEYACFAKHVSAQEMCECDRIFFAAMKDFQAAFDMSQIGSK